MYAPDANGLKYKLEWGQEDSNNKCRELQHYYDKFSQCISAKGNHVIFLRYKYILLILVLYIEVHDYKPGFRGYSVSI